jgi:uncharacterized membrane protein YccC
MTSTSAPGGPSIPAGGPRLGWLAEAVRPRREAVPWAEMARSGLAITVPLAGGIALGHQVPGLLIATGGLLGAVVDRGGPYLLRLRRIGTAAVAGGAVGLTIGGLIYGHGWLAVVVLILVAGVSAAVSALGDIASVTGLQLLVYASFGTGPLGGLRPLWLTPVLFLAGVAWSVVLLLPGWIAAPRAGEQRLVAAVYQALAQTLSAASAGEFAARRRVLTAALNAAYDDVLTLRSRSGGRDSRLTRLIAILNQAHLITEAATAFGGVGRPPPGLVEAAAALAAAIGDGGPPPMVPELPPGATGTEQTLHDGLAGAADLLARRRQPDPGTRPGYAARRRARARRRLAAGLDQLRGGPVIRVFALRLMLCVGAAAAASEVLPLRRSYWVVLTVAIVLKPDFGSVFARALQRGLGTIVGAVAGALILAAVPGGAWLLLPLAVLAALLPWGRILNYGLLATFLTPLVVLLIDLLDRSGWRLAGTRLIDTLLGCAIVLIVGYAPWPMAWYAHLPRKFAVAARQVASYAERALAADVPGTAGRAPLRRQAYRALSDLRADFQRTMSEPPPVSRRATAWWPAVSALEHLTDVLTAAALALDHGAPPLPAGAAAALAAGLRRAATEAETSGQPPDPAELPGPAALRPLVSTGAVRFGDGDDR